MQATTALFVAPVAGCLQQSQGGEAANINYGLSYQPSQSITAIAISVLITCCDNSSQSIHFRMGSVLIGVASWFQ